MPDTFSSPVLLEFSIPGEVEEGLYPVRKLVPFDHDVVGVTVTVNTPAEDDAIFDVVYGPADTEPEELVSMWPKNNGEDDYPDNRPTIPSGSYDQAPIEAGSTTVTPVGTDLGVSSTYVNYNQLPYVAKPDPQPAQPEFEGNQPVSGGAPSEVLGTPNPPQASSHPVFSQPAGTAYSVNVIAASGEDATVTLWIIQH